MKFLPTPVPEAAPRLTGLEAPLVLEYLTVVGALVSRTVYAADRHPNTHPYLAPSKAIASAAGRAANEAAAVSDNELQQGSQTHMDIVDRTYEMMGLSGASSRAASNQASQQAVVVGQVPDSLEGAVTQSEIQLARAQVEASFARVTNGDITSV